VKLDRVVVTGLGVICAAGRNADEFWDRILSGRTALSPSRRPDLAPFGRTSTGEVPDAWIDELVDPSEARRYGKDVLLASIAAREAIRQAGLPGLPAGWQERTGIVLGKCQAVTGGGPRASDWIHSTGDDIASIIGITGPRLTIATACSAGSNAVGAGRDRIWAQDADIVLAGGVDVLQAPTYGGFHALHSVDSEPCSPYCRSGGLNLGEGSAFVVLERLEDATRRGAPVLAEVMGYGLSADAHHPTAPDPTGRGATLAVQRALADSGLDSGAVTYVNGHGTGTKANDAVERRIMRNVFRTELVPLTSTKSFVGHTLGAAGAIEAVASVLSIMHGVIPPTVNFSQPPSGDLDFVPNASRPADVEVVVSNSYAFGGNNASLVLARPRTLAGPRRDPPLHTAVITGVGIVGRAGIGVAEWEKWLSMTTAEQSATASDEAVMARLAAEPFAAAAVWRQMNGFTRLCTAATRLAVEDAGLPLTRDRRDDIGLILATMSGPAHLRSRRELAGREADGTREVHEFTQVTLNAPAGAVCQALAIRGITTTITHGGASGTLALETALDAIQLGRAEAIVVVAAEQACPEVADIYRSLGLLGPSSDVRPYHPDRRGTACGTAAVALVIESASHARRRQGRARARLASVAHASDNYHEHRFDPGGARYAAALRRALRRASLPGDEVGLVAGSATGTDLDVCEEAALAAVFPAGTPVVAMKALTGECEAASGLMNVAAPLLLSDSRQAGLPAFPLGSLGGDVVFAADPAHHAVATSASFGGTYGAVVLERET